MLKTYYRILLSAWKTFGFGRVFLLYLLVPFFLLFTRVTLFLDGIFFPKYRKLQVTSPVFIIAHPRSGTTFLHQLLTQTGEFVAFEAWQLFLPSLTARALLKPIVNYLIRKNHNTIVPSQAGSETRLDGVKTEEWLFLHKLDTQFLMTFSPLCFDEQEHPELRLYDQQSESRRQSSMGFFKGCLQRQMYYTGKSQVIAKMHFSTHRIKTLLEAFPDAKFIYLVRSPHETVPSRLSLNRNVLNRLWGLENITPEKLKRWQERKYLYSIDLYRYFYDVHKTNQVSSNSVMVLPYNELLIDLNKAFEKIVAFTGIKPGDRLRQAIEHRAQLQKDYKRKHQVMKLEDFGLTEEQISEDFSFVFEEYGFDKCLSQGQLSKK